MIEQQELFVKMATGAWDTYVKRTTALLQKLSNEALSAPTAPGRNTGTYILGHLIAVSDGMLPLFGFGDKLYPHLEHIFLANPENAGLEKPSLNELREQWAQINSKLKTTMDALTPQEWFSRHNAVSAEDFAKEPIRNKLNLLINRTNHLSYHLGQMIFLS
jgi:hypothetical protein